MARKTTTRTEVDSIRHKDTRTNIPAEELRDFVEGDERSPRTMLYPRDPSLDPQLVWKGEVQATVTTESRTGAPGDTAHG